MVRLLQPATATHPAVTHVVAGPSLTATLDRNPADPRISHELPLQVDEYGTVLRSAAIGEPRRERAATGVIGHRGSAASPFIRSMIDVVE